MLARAALRALDENANAETARAGDESAMGDGLNFNLKRKADASPREDRETRSRAGTTARTGAEDTSTGAEVAAMAREATVAVETALPRRFERALEACEATLLVLRFMRSRGQRPLADVVCENVERATGSRCGVDKLRLVAALAEGAVTLRARGTADDPRRVRVELDLGEDVSEGSDVAELTEMRRRVARIRERMVEMVVAARTAASNVDTEQVFDPESVPLPELADIEIEDTAERPSEPRLAQSASAPAHLDSSASARVSEGELVRVMSDLGPDCRGLSKSAMQAVLERQAAMEAYNSPSAAAERERRRLYGRLPHVFDAVRSTFAASKRRVMELNALLAELASTNARAPVSNDELIDIVRILARTCPEWCAIVHSRTGEEELFRVVARDPAVARDARARVANLCRNA